ncbi:hypothetical protein [Spartinivicinus poritis]|uniref:Uncharacterized protein n=1 Tax=Spartinivicinus poritis TaxID=2994640 RepID=A0ABT5U6C6_9GAMM|nr:hypothetical protein [Spartinivicinus sp. A2-2]MDE1461745.1 hypothetical protein [Spartinivicinus sp. A2-2]
MIDAKVWLELDDEATSKDVELKKVVIEGDQGAMLFEMTDEFTLLRYRFCWFLKVKQGKVTELIEIKEPIETP